MANKTLFQTIAGKLLPRANTVNAAGGSAYSLSPRQALAQYATTGCLNGTFYASAGEQLDAVLRLCDGIEPEFIARTALYARTEAHMKDMPALLCAVLSVKSPGLLAEVFDRVIDSPKMLRNFVQIMRSGAVGRKSLGTLPKRLIAQWLESRTDVQLFIGSVGSAPSLADIIRMVHPKPSSAARAALFGYLVGREHDAAALPELVQHFEKFKRNTNPGKVPAPDVPFELLTSLPLTKQDWRQIARNASWQMTRMNLNSFVRHGVFEDEELTHLVANKLRNPRRIAEARAFPYQLLTAWAHIGALVPPAVKEALQDALELAIKNVPRVPGRVYVFPDVSGSMHSPVTGRRPGATSVVRCLDVAALVAAAILRQNPQAEVVPFEAKVAPIDLNPRDSVLTNAQKLASIPCGGTNCSAPLRYLNDMHATGDLVIYISDNESWVDSPRYGLFGGSATETLKQWVKFKRFSPQAKMICIDIQPSATTQAGEREDIINVGGFSDQVFRLIADVARGRFTRDHQVNVIEKLRI